MSRVITRARLVSTLKDPASTSEEPLVQGVIRVDVDGLSHSGAAMEDVEKWIWSQITNDATLSNILSGDGVYNVEPTQVAEYPYIVIGDHSEDEGPGVQVLEGTGHANSIQLSIWSGRADKQEIWNIWSRLKELFHRQTIQI